MKEVYDCGLPFSEIISENLDALIDRVKKKKASLIIVDGVMGEGKTTFMTEIAEYITKHYENKIDEIKITGKGFYNKFSIDFNKQLAMGGEDFQEKLQMCKDSKLKVLMYDEAGDFSKKGAITQFNQRLMRVFQTFRGFSIIIILGLPCFDILENDLFKQGVPRVLFNCHDRDDYQGEIRGYALDEMFYLKKAMKNLTNPLMAYKTVTPNFRGHFLNLPYKLCTELDKLSTEAKAETLSTNILKNKGLVNYYDIGKQLGRSPYWVRIKLKELKIEPTTKYKQMNYFENGVIAILEQQKTNK